MSKKTVCPTGQKVTSTMATINQGVLESMPVEPLLLETGNWWFGVSWYGLLISGLIAAFAATATVAFLFAQFWSSGIRDKQTEWRTSSLELQTAEAKRDTVAALERIASLNKETAQLSAGADSSRAAIADANARALEAQAQLAQFKAPRTMTEVQARNFVEAASKYSGTQADIWIIGDTPEPTGIGQIIFKLLEASGWKTTSWNWTGGGPATGIAVVVKDNSDSDINQSANFLVDSLNAVGILSVRLNWGADWDKFPGMLNGPEFSGDKAAPIRIVVGTKPQQ